MKYLITMAIAALLMLNSAFATNQPAKQSTQQSAQAQETNVLIETSMGDITLALSGSSAKNTVQNFLSYVKSNFYDDTIFHRVIDGFMIQGGGFSPKMVEKTNTLAPIKNEGSLCGHNTRGTIAMARTQDPDSATSQFFINLVDNPFLDFTAETMQGWGYCSFGHVIKGMDVVDKIAEVSTTSVGPYQNVPTEPVVIKKISVITA